jgi:NAD(P)-dependent dehydrogenase (short-subunit alcohol dehydrogenase family)
LPKLRQSRGGEKTLLAEYPNRTVSTMSLDLASFASIEHFAAQLNDCHVDLDCFVNNVGVFHQAGKHTADGFELVMGTNYFGTYYLSEKVLYLETLNHPVTYINTIFIIHKLAKLDYSDCYCEKHYGHFKIYAKSKLALARYTTALVHRYEGSSVKICMNHPGHNKICPKSFVGTDELIAFTEKEIEGRNVEWNYSG